MPASHEYHRIGMLLRRHLCVTNTMCQNPRQIARQELREQRPGLAFEGCPPWSGQIVVELLLRLLRCCGIPDPDNKLPLGVRLRGQCVQMSAVAPSILRAANRERASRHE